jgi:hypothetical protein
MSGKREERKLGVGLEEAILLPWRDERICNAIGIVKLPVPVCRSAENFSPIPEMAPLPFGSEMTLDEPELPFILCPQLLDGQLVPLLTLHVVVDGPYNSLPLSNSSKQCRDNAPAPARPWRLHDLTLEKVAPDAVVFTDRPSRASPSRPVPGPGASP